MAKSCCVYQKTCRWRKWYRFSHKSFCTVPMHSCASSYSDVQLKLGRPCLRTAEPFLSWHKQGVLTWIATVSWWVSVHCSWKWQPTKKKHLYNYPRTFDNNHQKISKKCHTCWDVIFGTATRNCQEPKHQVWQIFPRVSCPTLPGKHRQCEFDGPWTLKMNRICTVYIYIYVYIFINKNSGCICICLWDKNTPRHM